MVHCSTLGEFTAVRSKPFGYHIARVVEQKVLNHHKKGFNSLVALVAWWIWTHRNAYVFDDISPSVSMVLQNIKDEVVV
jgi:hypothetical protein